ncbi:MAG: hypothetical protein G01um101448_1153 [Parcubacteria group bacterium Gr01-1014_48]|nr:MAG: hypothetical protein G01um101448_1153 [Parcubacteria group bacterium Gr01-1014_48]
MTMHTILSQTATEHMCTSAVIIRDGMVLLGLRHYKPDKWKTISVWTTPGGRCDSGETVEVSMRREVAEETGIIGFDIEQFLGEVPGAKDGDTLLVFLCTTEQEPQLMEPEKFSEWKWFPLPEIPQNFINKHVRKMIANLP